MSSAARGKKILTPSIKASAYLMVRSGSSRFSAPNCQGMILGKHAQTNIPTGRKIRMGNALTHWEVITKVTCVSVVVSMVIEVNAAKR